MRTLSFVEISLQSHTLSSQLHRSLTRGIGRALAMALLIACACQSAKAQYLGYAANAANNTVSVFSVETTSLFHASVDNAPGNQDKLLATVGVGQTPVRIAVGPNLKKAYVTNVGDNSLWIIDVTNISLGMVAATLVTNPLQLNRPVGIAIASVPGTSTGINKGKVLAFVANAGNNTVSVIDTTNDANALLGVVNVGPSGGSTPQDTVEVVATQDGTQVFVSNGSGIWTIDPATTRNGSATQVFTPSCSPSPSICASVNGTTATLLLPVSIATIQATVNGTFHTSLVIADEGSHPGVPCAANFGSVFILTDIVAGQASITTALQVPNDPNNLGVTSAPVAVSTSSFGGSPFGVVLDGASPTAWLFTGNIASGQVNPPVSLSLPQASAPSSLLVTPDGLLTYVRQSAPQGSVSVIQNFDTNATPQQTFCLAGSGCTGNGGNSTSISLGAGPAGLAFAFGSLDPSSPPVDWIIAVQDGTANPPPVIPQQLSQGKSLSVLSASILGNGDAIATTLSFGGPLCTIFGSSSVPPAPTCTFSGQGTNAIGGSATFSQSGVFSVSVTDQDSNGNTSTIQQKVNVGVVCTLDPTITPTSPVAVNQQFMATETCTAPNGVGITGTMFWGDTTSDSVSAPGNNLTPVTLTFTHSYANPKTYSVTASSADSTTAANGGTTLGGPLLITVAPISVTIASPPNPVSVQTSHSQTYTALVNFDINSRGVTWTLSGPGCAGSACGTLSSHTSTVAPFTITYTAPVIAPNPPTVTLTATSIADTMQFDSQTITVTSLIPPACTLTAPILVQVGASVTAALSSCSAQPGDSITAIVDWGDKTQAATTTASAGSNGMVTFSPSSFNHAYASAGSFSISVTLQDNTVSSLHGGATPASGVTYAMSIQPPSSSGGITVFPGQPGIFTVNFTGGRPGLTFTSITCTVAPTGPTCAVSPAALTLDASGNGSVQVTVNTIGPSSSLWIPQGGKRQIPLFASLIALPCLGFAFLGVVFSRAKIRDRIHWGKLLFLLTVALLLSMGACTNVERSNIPCASCTTPGSYTVTVTATTSTNPAFQASGAFTIVVAQ